MAIIKQVIKAVRNVPGDRDALADASQTQVYRLTGIEPEPVIAGYWRKPAVSIPTAHLKADKKQTHHRRRLAGRCRRPFASWSKSSAAAIVASR